MTLSPTPFPLRIAPWWLAAALLLPAITTSAQPAGPTPLAEASGEPIVDAREALRRKDRNRLAAQRAATAAAGHPLALWVDYWELTSRLPDATVEEVEAFYTRWRGSYVEDRLRNDWLLELGRRRDWGTLARDVPRFRMDDDREVTCYARLAEWQFASQPGRELREAARAAWLAQREPDDGCQLLAAHLAPAGAVSTDDLWRKARLALENQRPRLARQTALLVNAQAARDVGEALDNPMRFLRKPAAANNATQAELMLLAVMRLAANDHEATATQLEERWAAVLGPERAAWAWAYLGRQAAFKLAPEAVTLYQRAFALLPAGSPPAWGSDTLAWAARAALRANGDARWPLLLRALDALPATDASDPAWVYWRAQALKATAQAGEAGEAQRQQAQALLQGLAGPLSFYAKLAAEDLGRTPTLPAAPPPPTAAERDAVRQQAGLARALRMIDIGLRSEGVREWNFHARWLGERELLAAAQWACEREVWDRCISTSERMREQVDLAQRFPTPFRDAVSGAARDAGLEPAFVFGLIRQESRFVTDARSGAGASGLMQVMPATARWTARKIGLALGNGQITDRDTNLRLGAHYLKLLLEDLSGSQPLATAAYNAGPNRPRRWREGPVLDAAAWVENIPFLETRDYVKKVLSNAAVYAALLDGKPLRIKPRLGDTVGPREAGAPPVNNELP